jgi:hypothetical protein
LATIFANHVGFSFFLLLFFVRPLTDQIHIMDDEQVFAIGLVSPAISTSEAAREKTSGTFSQSLNLSAVVRCLPCNLLEIDI